MPDLHITPEPSDEEVAAIVAAIEVATPRAGAPAAPGGMPRWRWSGRWWTRPIPQRRVRPW
ncbi:hypothetical protein [Aquihabitans sp. McL0605]|uniref:hypothetical protein n=1 Tax=Aquihabitans sp. McL0605 TaxID=3415671 RepID=UPI003CEF89FD